MKRIIERHKYDTATAKKMAEWENDFAGNDFGWMRETLYRTRAGLWFVHGEGGASSRYAEPCGGNSWKGGEGIRPISEDDAKEWCEHHLDGDGYEAVFGEVADDAPGKVWLSATVAPEVKAALVAMAAERGCSIGDAVASLVQG